MGDLPAEQDDLARLLASLSRSARYRHVSPELVSAIGRRELATGQGLKAATKATKGRLHQIVGAFRDGEQDYGAWLHGIEAAAGDPAALRLACRAAMRAHASTRERLPLLDRFYGEVLAGIPAPGTVLDLGCGLHPLAIPWMGLPPGVVYRCYEIDAALVDFLNAYFNVLGIDGRAGVRDLAIDPPSEQVDLLLALKLLPTLDQLARGTGGALLRTSRAGHMVVSFPARSLGGRNHGMCQHYGTRFEALLAAEGLVARRSIAFPTELVFVI